MDTAEGETCRHLNQDFEKVFEPFSLFRS